MGGLYTSNGSYKLERSEHTRGWSSFFFPLYVNKYLIKILKKTKIDSLFLCKVIFEGWSCGPICSPLGQYLSLMRGNKKSQHNKQQIVEGGNIRIRCWNWQQQSQPVPTTSKCGEITVDVGGFYTQVRIERRVAHGRGEGVIRWYPRDGFVMKRLCDNKKNI